MKKALRERVWKKYDCHCAYCGKIIQYRDMQVDHIQPIFRNDKSETLEKWGVKRGKDEESNMNPSCARCNRWKSTFSLEQFREQIELQVERVKRDSAGFRMAYDFNLITINVKPVVFYFEFLALNK